MNPYIRSLDSLVGAMDHHVLEPTDAYGALEGLIQQHRDKIAARRAAQQDSLGSLAQLGYDTAMEGGTLEQLMANPQFSGGVAGLKPRAQASLNDLLGQQFSPEGQSSLKPSLAPQEVAELSTEILKMQVQGDPLPVVQQKVHTFGQQLYGDQYGALLPEVDALIQQLFSAPSSGYVPVPGASPSGG